MVGKPPVPPRTRRAVAEGLAIGSAVGALYLATLAGVHTEAEDSLLYLNGIQDGRPEALFNPYHLIYQWLGWAAFRAAEGIGYDGGPLLPVQILNAVIGALGIALLWILMRTVVINRLAALTVCGLIASSYGYWWYSVEVEVYILSTVLLVLALLVAHRAAISPSCKRFAVVGGAHGLAVLGHDTNVLFGGAVGIALVVVARTRPKQTVARYIAAYAAGAACAVIPPYGLAIWSLGLNSPIEVYDWLTGYAQQGQFGSWTATTVPRAMFGAARALVGGHFAYSNETVQRTVATMLPSRSLCEERFLVRDIKGDLVWVLFALSALVALLFLVVASGWLRRPVLAGPTKTLALLCLGWLVPFTVFFAWWEPHNAEFWIAWWVPAAILIALPFTVHDPLQRRRRLRRAAVVSLIGTMLVVNGLGSVWVQHDPRDDYWRVRFSWYEQNATAADLIVCRDYISCRYLDYFTDATLVEIHELSTAYLDRERLFQELDLRLDTWSGDRILVSDDVMNPASDAFACRPTDASPEFVAALRERYLPRSRIIATEPLETIWELRDTLSMNPAARARHIR